MSKKVVIASSAGLGKKIQKWVEYWEERPGFFVVDWPKPIEKSRLAVEYPRVHQKFFQSITEADVLFVANEDKKGMEGYIGAETFAELTFAIAQNLVYGKKVQVILAKMPSEKVQSIYEIKLWLELGWIKIYE